MIYLDTSVVLAHLLAEDRPPPASLWNEPLVSSRLLEYEIWIPLLGRGLGETHGEVARWLIGQVAMLELTRSVLSRALDFFSRPGSLRTQDALHLASCAYLVENDQPVMLATYDRRMSDIAREMNIPLYRQLG